MGTIPAGGTQPPRDQGSNDRRVALRRSVVDSHLITVDLAFQSGALLLDLSETGMGVQALSRAPMGSTTPLHFELPETGGRVDGVGRIAWTDMSGRLGIRFEEIAELSRLHLSQWLARERRSPMAAGPNLAMPAWPPPHMRDEIAALRRDLTTEKLQGDASLAFIADRIRSVIRATGAAIALEDGAAIVCRASSGNAPAIGAQVDPSTGLSGECVRTGEIVRCEDTETDPRADRLVCRRLELRSIVIVPIRVQGRPAGVLEAFSSHARAFQSNDVLLLRRAADLIAEIAWRQPESPPSPAPDTPALMAAAMLEPMIHEPLSETTMPAMLQEILTLDVEAPPAAKPQPLKPPVRVEPAVSVPRAPVSAPSAARPRPAAADAAPLAAPAASVAAPERPLAAAPIPAATVRPELKPGPDRSAGRSSLPAEEISSSAVAAISAVIPAPEAVAVPVSPPERVAPAPPVSAPSFVKPRAMAEAATAATSPPILRRTEPLPDQDVEEAEGRSARDRKEAWPGIVEPRPRWATRAATAGIALAVFAAAGWQVWRSVSPPAPAPSVALNTDLKQPSPAAAPAVNSAAPALAANATPDAVTPNPAPLPVEPPAAQPAAVPAKAVTAPSRTSNVRPQAAEEPITLPAPDLAHASVPAVPPPLTLSSRPAGESSSISNVLGAPVAAPKLDAPRVSEMSGGRLVKKVNPVYPSNTVGVHGEVVLKAIINREGKVSKVQIIRGQALLAQAAASAVKRWRYEPFRLNGEPIEVENTIVVNFKAPGRQ